MQAMCDYGFTTPVDMRMIAINVQNNTSAVALADIDMDTLNRNADRLLMEFEGLSNPLRIYIRLCVHPHTLGRWCLSPSQANEMLLDAQLGLVRGRLQPGDCIGIDEALVATKGLTQLILNSVKQTSADVRGTGNVLEGIKDIDRLLLPRLSGKGKKQAYLRLIFTGSTQAFRKKFTLIYKFLHTIKFSEIVADWNVVTALSPRGSVFRGTRLGRLMARINSGNATVSTPNQQQLQLVFWITNAVLMYYDLDIDVVVGRLGAEIARVSEAAAGEDGMALDTGSFFFSRSALLGLEGHYEVVVEWLAEDTPLNPAEIASRLLDAAVHGLTVPGVGSEADSAVSVTRGLAKQYPHDSHAKRHTALALVLEEAAAPQPADRAAERTTHVVEFEGIDMIYLAQNVPRSVISKTEILHLRDKDPRRMLEMVGVGGGKRALEDSIANIYQVQAAETPPMSAINLLTSKMAFPGMLSSIAYSENAKSNVFGDSMLQKLTQGCQEKTHCMALLRGLTKKDPGSDSFKAAFLTGGIIRGGTGYFDLVPHPSMYEPAAQNELHTLDNDTLFEGMDFFDCNEDEPANAYGSMLGV